MLLKVKALLEERGRMSLRDLSIHFAADPQALEPVLEQLIRHGDVRRIDIGDHPPCSSCPGCSQAGKEAFCWFEAVHKNPC